AEAAATDSNAFALYHYHPTIAGAVIIAIAFIATTAFHFLQLSRKRCWFMIPLALGGILEVVGYGSRAKSGTESPDWTLGPYIIQAILLLVAPALYAATIYMEIGRIVSIIDGESRLMMRKEWMTKIFVTGDVLSFILQAGGGGYQASGTAEALDLGSKIIIVGLFVQLFFFGAFIVISVSFHLKINREPTARSGQNGPDCVAWRKHVWVLYVASFLIMVRSLFRAIEYLQGNGGSLLRHEEYLYIFDAVLMLIVMAIFNVFHPAEL
ncbi:RTA1 protein, partial [Microdochium trichocladiopsis]